MFDGLLGAALDFAGGIFAADRQNAAAEGLQRNNINWEREQLQNKHQWEVDDLRKAGLNPILTATTGSSAVSAGVPSASAPDINITKSLNAVANSALAKKEAEIAEYDAETRRITANAEKLKSKVEESKVESAIALNDSARWLNLQNADRIQHLWPMEVAYAKANVDYTVQKMINSIIEVNAKALYLDRAGIAQLQIGSAAQSQAAAAHRQVDVNQQIADTMEKNGVSERDVNMWKAGKYEQDIKEGVARTTKILTEDKNLNWQLTKDMFHNPNYARTDGGNWFTDMVYGLGEYGSELNPFKGIFK